MLTADLGSEASARGCRATHVKIGILRHTECSLFRRGQRVRWLCYRVASPMLRRSKIHRQEDVCLSKVTSL